MKLYLSLPSPRLGSRRSHQYVSRYLSPGPVVLLLIALLLTANFGGWKTSASNFAGGRRASGIQSAPNKEKHGEKSLAGILNDDGTVRLGTNGSFDVSGFQMAYAPNGAPRFVPAPKPVATCASAWDGQFASNGADNVVYALAVIGSDLYVGGAFKNAGNVSANRVAKYNTTTGGWSALGNGNGNGVDDSVQALAVIGSDLYVGGYFLTANVGGSDTTPSVSANYVARFNTLTGTWSSLGVGKGNGVNGGVHGFVRAMAVKDTDLYIGGEFSRVGNGQAAKRVAKFDTTTDIWSAVGSDNGNGVDDQVESLAFIGADLYVGGWFLNASVGSTNGSPIVPANRIARFNTTTGVWSALSNGNGNGVGSFVVLALAASGSDLYVGGEFKIANAGGKGATPEVSANGIAKFNTAASTWSAMGNSGGNGVAGYVNSLVVLGSDLYVAGAFIRANAGSTEFPANGVAKLNTITGAWSALSNGNGNGIDGWVQALALAGSELYLGGSFSTANFGGSGTTPTVSASNITKFRFSSGGWSNLRDAKVNNNDESRMVSALAVIGTDLYVGGNFTTTYGLRQSVLANNIAKFNTITGVWSPLGWAAGNGVNGPVAALAVVGSDLYIAGAFTTANVGGNDGKVVTANKIVKFATTATLSSWASLKTGNGNGLNGVVTSLAVNGSVLYVGGDFTTVNVGGSGATPEISTNHIATFNTIDSTWSALADGNGNGVDGPVKALGVMDSDLYVGGDFTIANAGGNGATPEVSANHIVRFNTTASTWNALSDGNGNGVDSSVTALAVLDSDLYVGGQFVTVNFGGIDGTPAVVANHIARFNPATSTWNALRNGDGNGVNGPVNALAAPSNDIYVAGAFTTANAGGTPEISANNIVKFDTTANTWSALDDGSGNGVNGPVLALTSMSSDTYVGGNFATAGGSHSEDIAHWFIKNPPQLSYANQTVTLNRALNINPAKGPADDGTISSIVVRSRGTYTGGISVDSTTGVVSISNAAPVGMHPITIRVTDNCGAFTDASFPLQVKSPANVSGTMTVAGDFSVGGLITYTVVLSNSSTSAQFDNPGEEFKDVLPPELTLVSAVANSGAAVADSGTRIVTWNGSIPAGGSVTITITATVSGLGVISNQGTIKYDADGDGINEATHLTDDPGLPGASDPAVFTGPCGPTVVTNNLFNAPGSFGYIIDHACPGSTITFDMTPGHVTSRVSAAVVIDKDLTIQGPVDQSLTLGGSMREAGGVLYIRSGTVNISNLTFSGGLLDGANGYGGGIYNSGMLLLTNCTVSDNYAESSWKTNGVNAGGGIYNIGTMTLVNSTVNGNHTYHGSSNAGGGIYNGGTMTLVNTTVSGNTSSAGCCGGGASSGGIANAGTMTLVNSTVSGNSASSQYVASGGGISNGGTATLINTIVAGNSSNSTPSDIGGTLSPSSSFNLIGTGGGGLINGTNGNQVGVSNTLLGPLANNGGPTQTMALLPGSPAINAGSNGFITSPPFSLPFTDQRGPGFERILYGTVDIGAFESPGFNISAVSGTPQGTTVTTAFALPIVAKVATLNGAPIPGAAVIFIAPASGPSGCFPGNASSVTVTADAGGVATSPVFTANNTVGGPYNVVATTGQGMPVANFALTNLSGANVSATKVVSGAAYVGDSLTITYTVVLTNHSSVAQPDDPGDEFTDVLPPELILASATATSGVATATINTRTVTWNGRVDVGSPVTITIKATVNSDFASGTISNQGRVNFDLHGNGANEASVLTDDPTVGGSYDETNLSLPCGLEVVTNANDSGAGSLRNAINEACAGGFITFAPGLVGPITLTTGELSINKNLTISGPGAAMLTISGNKASRVFNVKAGALVTITDVTISQGAYSGAGVFNSGQLTLTNCNFYDNGRAWNDVTISNYGPLLTLNNCNIGGKLSGQANSATGIYGVKGSLLLMKGGSIVGNPWGAVLLRGGSATFDGVAITDNTYLSTGPSEYSAAGVGIEAGGTVNIINSLIANNTASVSAGGIGTASYSPGGADIKLTIVNSTISGNRLDGCCSGGGLLLRGKTKAVLINVTVTGNRASSGGGIVPSSDSAATCTLRNTIIAGNFGDDVSGTLDPASSFNLIGTGGSGGLTNGLNGNQVGVANPGLGALVDNGGLTQTHALLSGSPAINAGSNAFIADPPFDGHPFTDQRGSIFARIANATVDIGAFEFGNIDTVANSGASQSTPITTAFAFPLVAKVTDLNGQPVAGAKVTFTAPASGTSGTFSGSVTSVSVTTDANGLATSSVFTANGVAGGPYNVVASIGKDLPVANFALTNLKGNQTITFGALANKAFGDPDFRVSALASSGLPVSFAASGQCTVAGNTVHITGAGSCTITASQAGDSNFNPAADVPQDFLIANHALITFSQSTYTVNENTGCVTITVNRTGDLSVPVTVDYATDDTGSPSGCGTLNSGMASARCDFGLTLGTLKFAPGDPQQTFEIPITQDSYSGGPEMFKVNLSNLTGAGVAFATPATATVTINDSPAPALNAIDDTDAFVCMQYHDFLNREPDAAGLAFWMDNIDKCNDPARRPAELTVAQCTEVMRVSTSAAFFLSIEFQQTGLLVRSFYVVALDRPLTNNMPAFAEFERDTQAVQRGVIVGQGNWQQTLNDNRDAFMKDFVTRAEFNGLYPTINTPTQYVDQLYMHAGLTPTSSERAVAIAEFGGAATAAEAGARGRALLDIVQNTTFQDREMNRSLVQIEYFGYLRRNPNDPPDGNFAGYNFWLNILNRSNANLMLSETVRPPGEYRFWPINLDQFNANFRQAEMVKAFIFSAEYRHRFGP